MMKYIQKLRFGGEVTWRNSLRGAGTWGGRVARHSSGRAPADYGPGRCPDLATDVPPNPCAPEGHPNHSKKYKCLALYLMFPLIALQWIRVFVMDDSGHAEAPCVNYEYMNVRSKRFPWGDGRRSLFHNPEVNHLPEECVREEEPKGDSCSH